MKHCRSTFAGQRRVYRRSPVCSPIRVGETVSTYRRWRTWTTSAPCLVQNPDLLPRQPRAANAARPRRSSTRLDNNLPPREFLNADYSFLNRELALHYGIEGVQGNQLQRVSLNNSRRGGLLGHGAFLTASANGVDTSPVVRGIYVLEKLLGYTPPPPPPDVPAIEPDIRGADTIRDLLQKHREVATCAECHRKIDPLGFALENFDAIGGWRDEYEKKTPIDPSGKLPGGDHFRTVPEFRKLLVDRQDQFDRCLTEKLLTYALGRELEIGDRTGIDQILADLADRKGGLRDLISLVVLSDPFLNN